MITFSGPNGRIDVNHLGMYSDNTPMVKHDRWEEIVECDTVTVTGATLHTLTTALFMVDAVNWRNGWVKNLILPYLPGARQDRMNPTGDVLYTAWSVAQMINQRHFSDVVAVDPHSEEMPRHINNFREFPLERVYDRLWKGYGGVIAPDKGALHRAEIAHGVIGGELITARKTRDVATGRLSGFEVDSLTTGRHYLVVDDICDGGGTFVGLGEKIREAGCYADLFVTHGIFSKGHDHLRKIYKNIITTDSIFQESYKNKLILSIVKEMENYV